jgi:hypothetical protein
VHGVGKLGGSEAGTETQPSDNALKEDGLHLHDEY